MRTYKKEIKTEEVELLDSIVCDRCHKKIDTLNDFIKGGEVYLSAGYGSRFDDEFKTPFDLCDNCLEELAKSFGYKL